uniref:PAK1 interacting protein 1 n=2 Tax=Oncorhynchus TaxID=8016 RepID=A0A8C7HXY8_ONCKI
MGPVIELIAGSYEQIAFGYRVSTGEEEWTATADFTHHAHTASVSAVATSERYIATGSRDETIQIYDMKKRVEHGALLHHDGTISCLEFYGSSHLLSGGQDGLLCVWSTRNWECLKSIRAHKGQVTSLSVHPSGKLALTVGTDKTLRFAFCFEYIFGSCCRCSKHSLGTKLTDGFCGCRTWNLIDGRSAFIKNIKQNAVIVKWSPEGDKYVVVIGDKVDVYDLETATLTSTIINPKRISSIKFLTNSILAIAGDDETVRLCDINTQKVLCEFEAHETRVKSVDSFTVDDFCVLVTASNDGFIKMWKLNLEVCTTCLPVYLSLRCVPPVYLSLRCVPPVYLSLRCVPPVYLSLRCVLPVLEVCTTCLPVLGVCSTCLPVLEVCVPPVYLSLRCVYHLSTCP